MTSVIEATATIWRKHMRKFLGNGEELFGTMIQPILWVVLFGVGMARAVGSASTPGTGSYVGFMLPGIVALSAMGGAIGGGMTWLDERVRGILKEYLVAPIPRVSILLGNVGSTVSKAMTQSIVIVVIGALIGAQVGGSVSGWFAGVSLAIGYSVGFSGLALAVASRTDDLMAYHAMIMLLNLPVLFLSNALYPLQSLPGWMRIGALANPTSYLVDGIRQSVVRGQDGEFPLWLCLAVVAGFAIAGLLLATRAISSLTRRK
jgi:ABC-2 type transport system permease protein